MKDFFHHLFLPRESNNHRAKILHHSSILAIIASLFIFNFLVSNAKVAFPDVLGITVHLSSEDLLNLTNQKREQNGLSPLVLNPELSHAAEMKAKDMFQKNYWAHTANDGTTPWYFIKNAGYNYVYAGENLARGFTDSSDVVTAWMESKSHRENMLSQNYKDIGFAVSQGTLLGEDTTLVVEMFGSTSQAAIARETSSQETTNSPKAQKPLAPPTNNASVIASKGNVLFVPSSLINSSPLINAQALSKNLSLWVLAMLVFVILVDIVIIERKKIVRAFTHNVDHLLFFGALFILIFMLQRGVII